MSPFAFHTSDSADTFAIVVLSLLLGLLVVAVLQIRVMSRRMQELERDVTDLEKFRAASGFGLPQKVSEPLPDNVRKLHQRKGGE